jgi:toxin YoeB
MITSFTDEGWEDYIYWVEHDRKMLIRLNEVIRDAKRDPFAGIGKPEPLRNKYRGWWSRRINHEHRLIYRVIGTGDDKVLEIAACRLHYR